MRRDHVVTGLRLLERGVLRNQGWDAASAHLDTEERLQLKAKWTGPRVARTRADAGLKVSLTRLLAWLWEKTNLLTPRVPRIPLKIKISFHKWTP